MPRTKRARIVHTSVVQKKPGKERAAGLFSAVQSAVSSYAHVFVLDVSNMRNTFLKSVRQDFGADARFLFGKTKVMAKALGGSEEDEHMPGLSGLAQHIHGTVGLMCTNRSVDEVLRFFEEYSEMDYARAGVKASRTFVVPAGVVYSTGGEQPVEDDVALPHSQEVTIRKWGMPTRLDKGRVTLDQDYSVCEEGKILNSNQTALLKLFGIPTAEFRIRVVAYWNAATAEVTTVEDAATDGDEEMD